MKRLGMVLLGLMFWSMNTLAQVTGSLDPEDDCYTGAANVNGKYSEFIQRFDCPADKANYGGYSDYGYWPGGEYCGRKRSLGYWVWVSPTWFVWELSKETLAGFNSRSEYDDYWSDKEGSACERRQWSWQH